MGWRERLRDVAHAGGAVAIAATVSGCVGCVPLCNANPDPCCRDSKSAECAAWNACAASDLDVFDCYDNRIDLSTPDLAPVDLSSARDVGAAD
jgi:hypothetical protein